MHGNTLTTSTGFKTRHYSSIISELTQSLEIHSRLDSKLQGVHFELTGEVGVTECVGGSMELGEGELSRKYESFCDPRLNYGMSGVRNRGNGRTEYGCCVCDCTQVEGGEGEEVWGG
jgi:3-deoxy-7-phosphoheptulonate synthase